MVAWDDEMAEFIEMAFGLRSDRKNRTLNELLEGLVINDTEERATKANVASLKIVSRAVACQIYASMMDRIEGEMSGTMTSISPGGWLTDVRHTLSPEGVCTTSVSLPSEVPKIDLFQFMGPSTRRLLLHMVQDPKSLGG